MSEHDQDERQRANTKDMTMQTSQISVQIRAILEEELGEFRAFADLPATTIEAMAAQLARALAPVMAPVQDHESQRAA